MSTASSEISNICRLSIRMEKGTKQFIFIVSEVNKANLWRTLVLVGIFFFFFFLPHSPIAT